MAGNILVEACGPRMPRAEGADVCWPLLPVGPGVSALPVTPQEEDLFPCHSVRLDALPTVHLDPCMPKL